MTNGSAKRKARRLGLSKSPSSRQVTNNSSTPVDSSLQSKLDRKSFATADALAGAAIAAEEGVHGKNVFTPSLETQTLATPPRTSDSWVTSDTEKSNKSSQYYHFFSSRLELPGAIRLLELLPQHFDAPHRIECHLHYAELTDRPLYSAVSYTWGDDSTSELIWVDGKLFEVRKNVRKLLSQLRGNSIHGQSRMLWIDSICINQADLNERNMQVRLMGEIYKNANYVVAWLDEGEPGSNYVQHALQLLHEGSVKKLFDVRKLLPAQISAFQWLFEHDYWQRRWIIQEIALARSTILISGRHQIPLSDFFTALSKIYNFETEGFLNPLQAIPLRYGMRSPAHLLSLSQNKFVANSELKELLYTYRDNQCSDPRDKIFALLSLTKQAQTSLTVNYAVKPITLLLTVLDFCISQEELDTFSVVGLGLLLRNQLDIKYDDLESSVNQRTFSYGAQITNPTLYNVTALVRGHISSIDVSAPWRSYEVHCRHILGSVPAFRTFHVAQLPKSGRSTDHQYFHLTASDLPSGWFAHSYPGRSIGHHDLCAFTFRSHHSDMRSYLGLASIRVDINDEIWQFRKTHVALVVRRNSDGSCTIVGRAFVLKRHGPLGYPGLGEISQMPPTQMLDFADDEEDAKLPSRIGDGVLRRAQHLVVDVPALFALLRWVDFG